MPPITDEPVFDFIAASETLLSDDIKTQKLTRAEIALIKMCLELLGEKFKERP